MLHGELCLDDGSKGAHEVSSVKSVEGDGEKEGTLSVGFLCPIFFGYPDKKLVRRAQDDAGSLRVGCSAKECLPKEVGCEVDPKVVGLIWDVIASRGGSAGGENGGGDGTDGGSGGRGEFGLTLGKIRVG